MNNVTPKTYLIGRTFYDWDNLLRYLYATNQAGFLSDIDQAEAEGLSAGEILCSFYAKLCYKSLVPGKNENITKTRSIRKNLEAAFDHGHGSVFEHCWFNFVTTNCSRVFTHELVRHRAGTAFSQTSGRYVRSDQIDAVLNDPILDEKVETVSEGNLSIRHYLMTTVESLESQYNYLIDCIDWSRMDRDKKKKLTSALRRILPNGQANEIGWSANIRALRHMIMMRTNRHAEWEIRKVFGDVYEEIANRWPLMVHGAKVEMIDDLPEVTGMNTQPY